MAIDREHEVLGRGVEVSVARVDGGKLAVARARAGLTQDELAKAIGAAAGFRIWQWERGAEQPRPHFVPLLAKALGVPPLQLLDCDPSSPPISALRLAVGLTGSDVCNRAMLARMTYARLDQGVGSRPPAKSVVRALAEALGVTPAQVEAAIAQARATRAQ